MSDLPFASPALAEIAAPDYSTMEIAPDLNASALAECWQTSLRWQPTPMQAETLQQLYTAIIAGNQTLNLTRITAPQDFWEKHLWDSLVGIARFLQQDSLPPYRLIDIGTGGGFPGLPIAIACPIWSVTLLDSTQKKINFLQQVAQQLGLTQVQTIVGRAEAIAHQPSHRAHYDIACIRAVGGASVCAEYALPFLKVGGLAILYRGQWTAAETTQLSHACECLGGTIEDIQAITTPLTQSARHLIYLRKHQRSPKSFPRAIGVPAKDPL